MDTPIFVDGVPRRITVPDIRRWHLMSFPDLADEKYENVMLEAIDAVYTMFTGCQTLFDMQPEQIYFDKTQLLFRLLACWYIADQYPLLVSGVPIMGGIPLKGKRIGAVALTFQDNFVRGQNPDFRDLLMPLKSNPWGHKAYMMISTAVKRVRLGGRIR